MNLTHLTLTNIKKIESLDFEAPAGPAVIYVKGAAERGKTTVLQVVAALFMGKKAIPEDFIRHGQKKGSFSGTLTDGSTITWTLTQKSETLKYELADGSRAASPQAKLTAMVGNITLDPWKFCRLKPAEQTREVLESLGLVESVEQLDKEHTETFSERTVVNREIARVKAVIDSAEKIDPSLPDEEINIKPLADELTVARTSHNARRMVEDQVSSNERSQVEEKAKIAELQDEIREIAARVKGRQELIDARKLELEADTTPSLDAIQGRLEAAEGINRQVRDASQARESILLRLAKQDEADQLTKQLEEIEARRRKICSDLELPVDGLKIVDGTLYLGETPNHGWSTTQGLRVAVALSVFGKPELKIIRITDGSLLDAGAKQYLDGLAAKGWQVWIECVSETGAAGLVIEATP